MAPASDTILRLRRRAAANGSLRTELYGAVGRMLRAVPDQQVEASWRPNPGRDGRPSPQELALNSEADETAYGGKAGGGKTSWLIGTGILNHHKAIIFRRQYTQFSEIHTQVQDIIGNLGTYRSDGHVWRLPFGKKLIYGACEHERDRENWQGNPHDFYGFDELTAWSESLFVYLCGWNRTSRPNQRCRICVTFNPPSTAEGQWVIDRYAAWIDDRHSNPASAGELRYFVRVKGRDLEVSPRFYVVQEDGSHLFTDEVDPSRVQLDPTRYPRIDGVKTQAAEVLIEGELYLPSSRTFIPAGMDDNPFIGPEYRAKVDAMPEPLRSQLKYGDFGAARVDDPWQIIPSAWIDAAFDRWKRRTVDLGPAGVRRPDDCPVLSQVGVDVAREGNDEAVIAKRYGRWFAYPTYIEKDTSKAKGLQRTGSDVGRRVAVAIDPGSSPDVMVDLINVGTSTVDWLRDNTSLHVIPFVASGRSSPNRTTAGGLTFRNDRVVAYWNMRELLDPDNGHDLMLPPSAKLRADLCSARYEVKAGCIQMEPKEDIQERLGRSPDTGDAFVLAALEELTPTLRF